MGNSDTASVDVRGRHRDIDRELPVHVGQIGIEGALRRNRIEVDRLLRRFDQLTTGKQDGRRAAGGPARYHFGTYPCLPLNTKPAGSRSILAAMILRLAVS